MSARLTRADYCEPDWGPIELHDDKDAYRSFWAAVLAFAAADEAWAVSYQLDHEDDCLAIEVAGDHYCLTPPPEEYRGELLSAGYRLATGDGLRGGLRRLARWVFRRSYLGMITVESPIGEVEWGVSSIPRGLHFRSKAASA